jgi:hypothetical protein
MKDLGSSAKLIGVLSVKKMGLVTMKARDVLQSTITARVPANQKRSHHQGPACAVIEQADRCQQI